VTTFYNNTKTFPKNELFGLVSQMQRAAVSFPYNIADGARGKAKLEFKQILYITLANGAELETQIIISGNLDYISKEVQTQLIEELNTISRMYRV
jgi:four helix bundle protein